MMMTRTPVIPRSNKSPNAGRKDTCVRFILLQRCCCCGGRRYTARSLQAPFPSRLDVGSSHLLLSPHTVQKRLTGNLKLSARVSECVCEWMVGFFCVCVCRCSSLQCAAKLVSGVAPTETPRQLGLTPCSAETLNAAEHD